MCDTHNRYFFILDWYYLTRDEGREINLSTESGGDKKFTYTRFRWDIKSGSVIGLLSESKTLKRAGY